MSLAHDVVLAACPYCTVANPSAHSSRPSGAWELGLVAVGAVIVALALLAAVRLLLRPGERSPDHIKLAILDDSAPNTHEA